MARSNILVGGSRIVVRVAEIAAGLFVLAILAGLLGSAVEQGRFTTLLLGPGPDAGDRTTGMRLVMLLGLMMGIATLVALRALKGIVASVGAGDPFVMANAGRLRRIGWALLFLQLLEAPGLLIAGHFPSLGAAAPEPGLSLGGWLAVLMLFVLAQVFAAGTAMRDDLAGTI